MWKRNFLHLDRLQKDILIKLCVQTLDVHEPSHVLGNAAIHDFAITEITLDNQKSVFDLTADGRDTVFNLLLPVDAGVRCRGLEV